MADHRDESGGACTSHPAASTDVLLALATIGSRMPAFHHDCASKLQSLMMSLDEITELAPSDDVRLAAETATNALRELHQLFTANRALAKSPLPTRNLLSDVIKRSAERAGVKLRGELPAIDVEASPQAMAHALALVLDIVAGASHLGRAVDVAVAKADTHAVVTLSGPPGATEKPPPNTSELLAIASFVIARDAGELRCGAGGGRFIVRLAISPS